MDQEIDGYVCVINRIDADPIDVLVDQWLNFSVLLCCVLDSEGRPVSWILTYASCAMGMLYTMPEHRRKGYAKDLVTTMAKKLRSEGYPVYCFIEEENQLSYRHKLYLVSQR
ncbi:glycine N-acyltransferase-like protein 3 [Ictalurus furcatus]|uniref:glycine N-acyltransferase-like protein 3 n=1 Tax=Ictalurus furcatus TaxID=66913 RepID=UPI0023502025|nr:glycine N-acyltransferase-like protein 3 [Ictalurus furcatus]